MPDLEERFELAAHVAHALGYWMATRHRGALMELLSLESEQLHENPDITHNEARKSLALVAAINRILEETAEGD